MSNFSINNFETLKNKVLVITGLTSISAADCKMLEMLILRKTNRRISETTLKRIYGFALSNYNPSLFTINTLARYCDYEGWDDYCKQREEQEISNHEKNVNWSLLKINANKITSFTLQALKNKSGVPYRQTVKRRFIDDHFNAFLNEGDTATVLSAPAGYGKTLALCHWIDDQQAKGDNDIILFFSSNALMNVFLSGRNINDWLLALLGYSHESDITSLLDIKQRKGGLFYLIIDGLDEHMFKNDQFQLILDQIIDIFSFYQTQPWFKLVLTMRSSTLINNRFQMEVGQGSWFSGFITNADTAINVPQFSLQELEHLGHNINPSIQSGVTINMAEVLGHPLYFQIYYKQHKKDFSFKHISRLSIYDLTSSFVLNKIYQGHYSAEKVLVISALVDGMDLRAGNFEVSKLKVVNVIRQYSQAYYELISIGFLRELNTSDDADYNSIIQFTSLNFLEFSVAKVLLLNNDNLFNQAFVNTLNTLFTDSPNKLAILKWTVIHSVKNEHFDGLNLLPQVRLSTIEKSALVVFVGALLEREVRIENKTPAWINYFNHDFNSGLFNYLFGLEYIDHEYIKTLSILFEFKLSTAKKIMVYCGLATVALLKLEMSLLEKYLDILGKFSSEDYAVFPVNPFKCLAAIHQYFKYGLVKNDILTELTRFAINAEKETAFPESNTANDLFYLLGAYTLKICNNPNKTLRFINTLNKNYRPISDTPLVYNIFLKRVQIEEYFAIGKPDMAVEIYYTLHQNYQQDKAAFTPFMKSTYNCVKIITGFYSNEYGCMLNAVNGLNLVYDDFGYKLSKLYVLTFLLKNQTVLDSANSVYKQLKYDYTKIIRESGLSARTFIKQDTA